MPTRFRRRFAASSIRGCPPSVRTSPVLGPRLVRSAELPPTTQRGSWPGSGRPASDAGSLFSTVRARQVRGPPAWCAPYEVATRLKRRLSALPDFWLSQTCAAPCRRRGASVKRSWSEATGPRLGRHPLPERGGEHRGVRHAARVRRSTSNGISGEVIVVDNGSDDGSAELARAAGARVVHEPRRGYGSAYLAGFAAARGDYIVMIDADLTYDFARDPALRRGARRRRRARDGQPDGQHPRRARCRWLNRHIGNPLLSGFLNLLYRTTVRDVALRHARAAARRAAAARPPLDRDGVRVRDGDPRRAASGSTSASCRSSYHPRGGESKLSPLRDGWRHLRLILVYSPNFLFIVPGARDDRARRARRCWLVFAHSTLFGRGFYVHTLIGGSLLVIVGIAGRRARALCAAPTASTSWASATRGSSAWQRALQARARAAARRGADRARRPRRRRRDRRQLDRPRRSAPCRRSGWRSSRRPPSSSASRSSSPRSCSR